MVYPSQSIGFAIPVDEVKLLVREDFIILLSGNIPKRSAFDSCPIQLLSAYPGSVRQLRTVASLAQDATLVGTPLV